MLRVYPWSSANIRHGRHPEPPNDQGIRHAHDVDRGEKQRQSHLKVDRIARQAGGAVLDIAGDTHDSDKGEERHQFSLL